MRRSNSIVVRSALLAAALCGLLFSGFFLAFTQAQRSIFEEKVIKDTEEVVSTFASLLMGFFYTQGNWVHLEEHQQHLNSFANTLYSYIINDQGKIDLGLQGVDSRKSPDVGAVGQSWEPSIPLELDKPFRIEFRATQELVDRFPKRVNLGDKIVLIGGTVYCAYTRPCGQLRLAVAFDNVSQTLDDLRNALWLFGIGMFIMTALIVFVTTKRQLQPIRVISERMFTIAEQIDQDPEGINSNLDSSDGPLANHTEFDRSPGRTDPTEISSFKKSLKKFTDAIARSHRLGRELEVSRTVSNLATQVVHDIRAPLTTLTVLVDQANNLPDEQRASLTRAMQRITDIANQLLATGRRAADGELVPVGKSVSKGFSNLSPIRRNTDAIAMVYLSSESIISEIRLQVGEARIGDVSVTYENDASLSFVAVAPHDLERMLSNILINAVEACDLQRSQNIRRVKCEISLLISSTEKEVRFSIRDNGPGVPSPLISRLGERGFTYGKAKGNGLGLYHAKTTCEAAGGSLNIVSPEGQGTNILIVIPRVAAPGWFLDGLCIERHCQVVIVDDDVAVHDQWRQRFVDLKEEFPVRHLSSVKQFSEWLKSVEDQADEKLHLQSTIFLMDYEFSGESSTGITVISELAQVYGCPLNNLVLVTNRFDQPSVIREVQEIGIRLLPKQLLNKIPVIQNSSAKTNPDIEIVVIDDDIFLCETWATLANEAGLKISTFHSVAEFDSVVKNPSFSAFYFIDVELSGSRYLSEERMHGIQIAKALIDRGCKRVYLATSYEPSELPVVIGLAGVISKEWPASLFEKI